MNENKFKARIIERLKVWWMLRAFRKNCKRLRKETKKYYDQEVA